ncbi:MAG: N-acyl-D-amino-acid deacylase family protein [Vicinamibacterales bacterium]
MLTRALCACALACLAVRGPQSAIRDPQSSIPGPQSAVRGPQSATGLLVRNGTVIDGTGGPGRTVDVRIAGDAIVELGPSLAPRAGERVIDAAGRVVAPGFIDTHSHADRGLEDTPDAGSQVRQGITTAVVGQDGGGELPVSAFLDGVDRLGPAINYATAAGHGTVRGLVMGADFKRAATAGEIETMKALVDRAMKDGALGLSSGLEYDPGFYAKPEELIELASVVAKHGGYYTSHVRDEENEVFAAWSETIEVGRRAGLPVLISHAKVASKPVWGKAGEALRLLEDANRAGLRVRADWYPYTYWQSSMYVLIPDRDFENRKAWEVGLEEIGGPQNVLVTSYRPNMSWNGKTIAEIAREQRTDAVTLVIEMMRASGGSVGIIGTSMDEADLMRFAAHPLTFVCSDGGLSGRHPRGYGAFPRVLATYVREQKALDLPGAINKMTGGPAAFLGLADRGVIAPRRKADLVVFDPVTIQDRGTRSDPALPPVGVHYVVVNGEIVLDEGTMTGARPGRAIRGQAVRRAADGARAEP